MSLIIFDWDDTLCPTTWIYDNDLVGSQTPLTKSQHDWLHICGVHLRSLLSIAMTYGDVMILTNSTPGWVSYCVKRYLPTCENVVERCNVHYAWQSTLPDHRMWKIEYLRSYFMDSMQYECVLGVGDMVHDRLAIRTTLLGRCTIKTLKLLLQPTVEDFIFELIALIYSFDALMERSKAYDLMISTTPSCS